MDWNSSFWWVLWARGSSYSPLNLGHLPQPIPRDAPVDCEPGVFTFQDAFEDLLAVSSGYRLLDMQARYERSKVFRQMYPHGEDAASWVRRLHSQNLLEHSNFFSLEGQSHFHGEFRRSISLRAERGARIERNLGSGHPQKKDDGLIKWLDSKTSHSDTSKEGKSDEADTWDDVFSAWQSAFSLATFSLSTLLKMAGSSVWSGQAEDGTRGKQDRIETREEYTDMHGNHHMKRTVRILNEKGEEVGQEVYVETRGGNVTEHFPEEEGSEGQVANKEDGIGKK